MDVELVSATTSSVPPGQEVRILLIDDDEKLCRLLSRHLATLGYTVVSAHDGLTGMNRFAAESWNMVLVDIMLPGIDGLEVLKRIRSSSSVPVVIISARGEETDRILGLEIGADDYVPKTYSTRELVARIKAVHRRSHEMHSPWEGGANSKRMAIGELTIDLESYEVHLRNKELSLTAIEFNLLVCLAKAKGKARSREQLLNEVRSRKLSIHERSIDVHVSSLRRKLGGSQEEHQYIKTVRTVGYKLINPRGP